MSFKNQLSIQTAVIGILLTACLLLPGCEQRSSTAAPTPAAAAPAVVCTAKEEVIELKTTLPGRTSAFRIAEIRPQVNGLILQREFTEGADVAAGDVLYQIDPASFQASLDNAQAALDRSKAYLPAVKLKAERSKHLVKKKAVSQQAYDDAQAALNQAYADIEYYKAMVEAAKINLGYTHITSPISGRIGRSNFTDGAIVTAYQPTPLATVQQLDPIYVDVPQSTVQMLHLKQRMQAGDLTHKGKNQNKVTIIMEDGSVYPLKGTFQFRDVTVDPTTASVILRVEVPNPEGTLLPGMFVQAVMREGKKEHAILVPQQAVMRDRKGTPSVLIVDDNDTVQSRILTIDRVLGDKWLVKAGIAHGERIIVEGLQKARPGATVTVIGAQPAAQSEKITTLSAHQSADSVEGGV